MARDVFIGDFDDPEFSWQSGDWNANLPTMIGSMVPWHAEAFWDIVMKVGEQHALVAVES